MHKHFASTLIAVAAAAVFAPLAGCGGGGDSSPAMAISDGTAVAPVVITSASPNAVSRWNEIATNTINATATPGAGTAAEQRPDYAYDLAAVHLAIYDALMAITPTHRPYAVTPAADASGASQEAAVAAAAYGVLKRLYPARTALYQGEYDTALAALPVGDAKTKGLALGAEVAQTLLDAIGDDGRSVALAPYMPGTAPGRFRGLAPVNRQAPLMKPYALTAAAQFRAPPPPALDSATFAADYNESRLLGGLVSTTRTDAQLDAARFHSEPPSRFWPRNLRKFATTDGSLAEHARLMAMLYTAEADATIACFESKYFYEAWRPLSAIPLGDTDGNPATTADPGWLPVLPTPNHPEYPAAHSCASSAVGEVLKSYYGTGDIGFGFDSTVSATAHLYTSIQGLLADVQIARIAGGMHFRFSTAAGAALGTNVGQWVAANHFQLRTADDPPKLPVPRCPSDSLAADRTPSQVGVSVSNRTVETCRSL